MRFVLMIVASAVVAVSSAHAQAPGVTEPTPSHGQRSIGVGAEIGANGLGAAVHAGSPTLGLYLTAGVMPVLVFGNERNATRTPDMEAYGTFELTADLYALLAQPSPRSAIGLCAGYNHNSLLGHGGNLGIAVRHDLGDKVALTVFGGLVVFPSAKNQLLMHSYPANVDPMLPELQGGINVGLVFYP